MKTLTDAEYAKIREELHHMHDKIWKIIFMSLPAMREYLEKVILPQLKGITLDLDDLVLDNTSYVNQKLDGFFSDLVYMTTLIDQSGSRKPIKIALLLEHKSGMPTQLQLRLQLLEYIVAIQTRHYNKKTDKTVFVLPIVFNQFDKNWKIAPYRSLFDDFSPFMRTFIPEFGILLTNLPDLSADAVLAFEKYGELRAGLLAMKHAHNKRFLKRYFAEIFVFLERHPDKTALRNQLLTYIIGASALRRDELEKLLHQILNQPYYENLKEESMGILKGFRVEAYLEGKEAEKKERAAIIQFNMRSLIMRLWKKGTPADFIADVVQLPLETVQKMLKSFEETKIMLATAQKPVPKTVIAHLTGLTLDETAVLVKILQE